MQTVRFYGRLEQLRDEKGKIDTRWVDTHNVVGLPFDVPISGYGTHTVNTLRLWSARATEEFDLAVFNDGDFRRAVEDKVLSESISKVLYPNDQSPEGKELRLKQQYFFVACSIADIMRRFKRFHDDIRKLPEHAAIHLNDTHPSIAVAELMRVLLDDEQLPWEQAWDITQRCTAYTNHTLLPEALERWPVAMFEHLLPRHMAIIYQINSQFLDAVHIFAPDEPELQRELSLIEEGHDKQVRMGHLAVVGSHSVNGVAKLHSDLIKRDLMKGFARLWPERFNNKTNGVTPRRWLLHANPRLSALISSKLEGDWSRDLDRLRELNALSQDQGTLEELGEIKRHNKTSLAAIIHETTGERVDTRALFVAHVKRIHEYKRQLLTCLQIIALYRRIKDNPNAEFAPRLFILAGKAAPGYAMAKLHIKLLNDVARLISKDPTVRGRLKVVFLPNYRVSLAERIIPASDLSLQVSLAGMEASGTSNMKFAMNGALTMGTLDGANIEILEQVGEEHFFKFGLTSEQVAELRAQRYHPSGYLAKSAQLRGAVEAIEAGLSSRSDRERFGAVTYGLRHYDHYLTCADFDAFMAAHDAAVERFADPLRWQASALVNIANVGPFSSDRTVRQYAEEIWRVDPVSMKGIDAWRRSPSQQPPRG
jgi:starch phosphorylase